MIRFLMLVLLVVVVAVTGTLLLLKDPGYVLLSYGGYAVETTLSFVFLAGLVTVVLLNLLIRIIRISWNLPEHIHQWGSRRKGVRTRMELNEGLRELAAGHWHSAERKLVHSARTSEMPLINYLGAARAAQRQGAHEQRDAYLQLAYEHSQSPEMALGLTRAELQMDHGQLEEALATLAHLQEIESGNTQVLQLLLAVYQRLGEWRALRGVLPELRKNKVVSEQKYQELETEIARQLLTRAAQQNDMDALQREWDDLPRSLRDDEHLVLAYAGHLQALGQGSTAEQVLHQALKHAWNTDMVYLYGLVEGEDPAKQLKFAETLLQQHEHNPVLHLTLGRLCLRNRLWGMARTHLENSIKVDPRAETYRDLGLLLERLGDHDTALECCQKGLADAMAHLPSLVPDLEPSEIRQEANTVQDRSPAE